MRSASAKPASVKMQPARRPGGSRLRATGRERPARRSKYWKRQRSFSGCVLCMTEPGALG